MLCLLVKKKNHTPKKKKKHCTLTDSRESEPSTYTHVQFTTEFTVDYSSRKTYNKTHHETFKILLYKHCRCLCNTLQNAENAASVSQRAQQWLWLFSDAQRHRRAVSRRYLWRVPWYAPLTPPPHTLLFIHRAWPLLSSGPSDGRLKKEAVVVSLQELWMPVSPFFFFLLSCLTCFTPIEGEVKGEERKLYCAVFHHTISPPYIQHPQ